MPIVFKENVLYLARRMPHQPSLFMKTEIVDGCIRSNTGHQKLRNVDGDMEQSEALQLLDDFLAAVHFTGEGKGFHWTQAPCHETDLLPGKLLLSWQLWPQELQGNLHNFLVIVTEEWCRYPGRSWWDLLSHQLEINNPELQRQGWAWLHRFPHQNSWVSSCPRG